MCRPSIIKRCAVRKSRQIERFANEEETGYFLEGKIFAASGWHGCRKPGYNHGIPLANTPLVLIVDDDIDTREMYGWCIEGRGFRVALASTAGGALAHAAAEVPDVVITDYTLPGGDGFALADTLREAPATRHVPLILVSGRDFAGEAHAKALRLFDRVLLKPVLPDELIAEMLPLVAGRTAQL